MLVDLLISGHKGGGSSNWLVPSREIISFIQILNNKAGSPLHVFFQIPCVFTVELNFHYANFSDLQLFYVQN